MHTQARLEQLYDEIKKVILSRQHPVTGLLPASTAVNMHGDYTDAWVRDNVYSIIAPWSLSMAFRRQGNAIKQDELEQATIKLMRGLLQAMMRQADKVEVFKHTLNPLDSLHAKYDTASGLPVVADDAWGHLQIDATSIYLLMVAQMTRSGLRIIHTFDEVDFIQNLIYYIASAYRTPDYGIWERGNKINNGKTEINASSVGMAKAALLALDGLNLFGKDASPRAIAHTVADSISLARNSLASLLPRESLSKEVDSALLSVIGFPAFAVGDNELVTKTRDEILKKLGGKYGCKRFLWDGHQTAIEDPHRLYYEHSELASFEHIESEWPLFFSYLYLNALFRGNAHTAQYYRNKIESIMVDVDGTKLIPELFYLEDDKIAAEKSDPGSQDRVPNENVPLVWAQSLYYTAVLLDENFIKATDLDGAKLRGTTTRFNRSQVALVVLAENDKVKRHLIDNGVIAESIGDISPIKVISAPHLVEAYAQVGANQALNLSGRPRRRLQSLATSQTYDINGQRCLSLSWIQSEDDDYRMRDAELVSEKLKSEIRHIRKHWLNSEVGVFTFMMTENLCDSPTVKNLFDTLKGLQLRSEDENVGYASASLAYRASRENQLHAPNICLTTFQPTISERHTLEDDDLNLASILDLAKTDEQTAYLKLRESTESIKSSAENKKQFETLYQSAQLNGYWLIARKAFLLTGRAHSDLGDYLMVLSARHFSIIVGSDTNREFSIGPTLNNEDIVKTLENAATTRLEHCLLQEVLATIGAYQRTRPQLFEGLRSIHLHNLLKLCLTESRTKWDMDATIELGSISPYQLVKRIGDILQSQYKIYTKGLKKYFPTGDLSQDDKNVMNTDWFEWRVERGLIVNLDRSFLEAIWQSFAYTRSLILGDSSSKECVIDCELVRKSMTSGEEIFAKLIDDSIQQIHPPYYKSAIIETLLAFTRFTEKHSDTRFKKTLNLNEQLEAAAQDFCSSGGHCDPSTRNIDAFLQESPKVVQHYLEKALLKTAGLITETA